MSMSRPCIQSHVRRPLTARVVGVGLVAALAHLAPLPAAAEPYSFRGVPLGAPLSELRRLKFPEAPAARMICSPDPEAQEVRPTSDNNPKPDEIDAGVVVCGSFTFGRVFGSAPSSLPPEWLPAKVQAAGVDVNPTFWFVPPPGAAVTATAAREPRLYRIMMRSNSAYWEQTKASFIKRYGKPSRVEKIPYTGYRGNRLDNERAVWSNPDSTITLTKRSQLPNQLLIVYEHADLTPAGARMGEAPDLEASPQAPPSAQRSRGPG